MKQVNRRVVTRKETTDYYLIYNRDTSELLGRLLDLTPNGLLFMNESEFVLNTFVPCHLELPRMIGNRKHILFDIQTKRSHYNRHCDWYEIGCSIHKLKDDDRKLLNEIIDEWKSKKTDF